MVGDKAPIADIADEYAKADPVYVEKTMVSFLRTSSQPPNTPSLTFPASRRCPKHMCSIVPSKEMEIVGGEVCAGLVCSGRFSLLIFFIAVSFACLPR